VDALHCIYKWAGSTEHLNLILAVSTVILAILAVAIAFLTLSYMRGRDLEVDTRSGWIEIHKAMINLRVQRAFVMLQLGALGGGENVKGYTLASAQLRAQLDRLNDDPLVVAIAEFLDNNILATQWQTPQFEKEFDAFVHKVAFKARPDAIDKGERMSDTPLRDRLRDLNTKAYYLLVALSFVYGTSSGSRRLKAALTLTALVAVVPVQDYIEKVSSLEWVRRFKILGLILALACTLWWVWTVTPATAK